MSTALAAVHAAWGSSTRPMLSMQDHRGLPAAGKQMCTPSSTTHTHLALGGSVRSVLLREGAGAGQLHVGRAHECSCLSTSSVDTL